MTNAWLKIKIWFKLIVFGLIAIYVLLFFLNNTGKTVQLWLWFGETGSYTSSVLALVFSVFVVGVIGTFLTSTIWRTVRQIREAGARSRTQRLEKAIAEMNAKAAKLQIRPETGAPSDTP